MILPSKRVLSIFILTAALVVAIIIGFGRDKASLAINYASDLVAGEKVSVPENSDWQNELSGLGIDTAAVQVEEDDSTPETVTDTVSQSLMSNYLAMKESGTLDNTSAQKLIDQSINYMDQTSSQTAAISQLGLNVVADNGNRSITDYGENLGNIIRVKNPADIKGEITLLTQVVQSEDESKINELDATIADYEKIILELIKMPVPKTFVKAHLDIVNGTKGITSAFTEMKSVFNDPIKGLAALKLYQAGATKLSAAMNATITFIKQNNIIYKQGSGGYYLLYGI